MYLRKGKNLLENQPANHFFHWSKNVFTTPKHHGSKFAALPPILDCPKKPSVLIFYSKFTFSPPVFAGEEFSATPPLPAVIFRCEKSICLRKPQSKKVLAPLSGLPVHVPVNFARLLTSPIRFDPIHFYTGFPGVLWYAETRLGIILFSPLFSLGPTPDDILSNHDILSSFHVFIHLGLGWVKGGGRWQGTYSSIR